MSYEKYFDMLSEIRKRSLFKICKYKGLNKQNDNIKQKNIFI